MGETPPQHPCYLLCSKSNTYLLAVVAANANYASALASAKADYDDVVADVYAVAASDASAAYTLYQSATASAHQTYVAAEESAYAAYEAAVDSAYTTAMAALEQADAAYASAIDDAEAAYEAAVSAADQIYQATLADADATYEAAIEPYQQARDQAYANLLANPEDPQAQAAYEQAEQDLADAIAQAALARDAAYADAQADFEAAEADPWQALNAATDAAFDAYHAVWNDIQQEWEAAEAVVWDDYSLVAETAWSVLGDAEEAAWLTYLNVATSAQDDLITVISNAAVQFQSTANAALAIWNAAEGSAWNDYLNAIGTNPPEERITAPSVPPPSLDSTELPLGQRDPGQLLAMGQTPRSRFGSGMMFVAYAAAASTDSQNFWNAFPNSLPQALRNDLRRVFPEAHHTYFREFNEIWQARGVVGLNDPANLRGVNAQVHQEINREVSRWVQQEMRNINPNWNYNNPQHRAAFMAQVRNDDAFYQRLTTFRNNHLRTYRDAWIQHTDSAQRLNVIRDRFATPTARANWARGVGSRRVGLWRSVGTLTAALGGLMTILDGIAVLGNVTQENQQWQTFALRYTMLLDHVARTGQRPPRNRLHLARQALVDYLNSIGMSRAVVDSIDRQLQLEIDG